MQTMLFVSIKLLKKAISASVAESIKMPVIMCFIERIDGFDTAHQIAASLPNA
jgi:hypothetical protein